MESLHLWFESHLDASTKSYQHQLFGGLSLDNWTCLSLLTWLNSEVLPANLSIFESLQWKKGSKRHLTQLHPELFGGYWISFLTNVWVGLYPNKPPDVDIFSLPR